MGVRDGRTKTLRYQDDNDGLTAIRKTFDSLRLSLPWVPLDTVAAARSRPGGL